MRTRPASAADFSAIADISVAAFWNDELYAFTNPYRVQYPHDFRNSFLRRAQLRFWTPGHVFVVAETDDEDIGQGVGSRQVVGYALWILERGAGKSIIANAPGNSWMGALERGLYRLRDAYVDFLGMDRSLQKANLAIWAGSQGNSLETCISENAKSSPAVGYYELQNLCVHPSWQRRGVGGLLIQWGLSRAREEDVPVVLTSSEMGAGLYLREGFRRVGEMRVDGWLAGGERKVDNAGQREMGRVGREGEVIRGVDVGVLAEEKGTQEVAVDERFPVPIFLWEPNYQKEDNVEKR